MSRLCEPIEGLDAAQIAECLGKGQRDSSGSSGTSDVVSLTQAWIPQATVVQSLGKMTRDVGRRCWEGEKGS